MVLDHLEVGQRNNRMFLWDKRLPPYCHFVSFDSLKLGVHYLGFAEIAVPIQVRWCFWGVLGYVLEGFRLLAFYDIQAARQCSVLFLVGVFLSFLGGLRGRRFWPRKMQSADNQQS